MPSENADSVPEAVVHRSPSEVAGPCRLLRLPAEMRKCISEMVFAVEDETDLVEARPPRKALLSTCRQIYNETKRMYKENYRDFYRKSCFFTNNLQVRDLTSLDIHEDEDLDRIENLCLHGEVIWRDFRPNERLFRELPYNETWRIEIPGQLESRQYVWHGWKANGERNLSVWSTIPGTNAEQEKEELARKRKREQLTYAANKRRQIARLQGWLQYGRRPVTFDK